MKRWACIYCGKDWDSPNGLGTDVHCCGEVGHVEEFDDLDSTLKWPPDEHADKEIGE